MYVWRKTKQTQSLHWKREERERGSLIAIHRQMTGIEVVDNLLKWDWDYTKRPGKKLRKNTGRRDIK